MPAIAPSDAPHRRGAGIRLGPVVVERRDTNGARVRTLDIDALDIAPGARVGITGPSGSGKTTLLNVIAGLAVPSTGDVRCDDVNTGMMTAGARDAWRRDTVGVVFQDFDLIPELNALDNVLLPLTFDNARVSMAMRHRAAAMLRHVGIDAPHRRAAALSRGEQQRVAVARALIRAPRLLLADEPTASLDTQAAAAITDLLLSAAGEHAATLVVVSHDATLLARLDRRLRLQAGRLVAEDTP